MSELCYNTASGARALIRSRDRLHTLREETKEKIYSLEPAIQAELVTYVTRFFENYFKEGAGRFHVENFKNVAATVAESHLEVLASSGYQCLSDPYGNGSDWIEVRFPFRSDMSKDEGLNPFVKHFSIQGMSVSVECLPTEVRGFYRFKPSITLDVECCLCLSDSEENPFWYTAVGIKIPLDEFTRAAPKSIEDLVVGKVGVVLEKAEKLSSALIRFLPKPDSTETGLEEESLNEGGW